MTRENNYLSEGVHCGENCCYKAPLILFISLGKLQADQRLMKKLGTLHWKFLGCFCRINLQSIKVFPHSFILTGDFTKLLPHQDFLGFSLFSKFLLDGGRIKVKEPAELSYTCSIYRAHFVWCYFLKLFCPFKI